MSDKCTFAHGTAECAYWIALYERQSQHLAQLQKNRLLTDSFSEEVRRRVKCEGALHVVSKSHFFFNMQLYFCDSMHIAPGAVIRHMRLH